MTRPKNNEQPSQSKIEDNPDIAHYMGYGEKPEIEAGLEAVHAGRFSEVGGHFAAAEKAGLLAVQEYVIAGREGLDAVAVKNGVETSDTPELEQKVEAARQELAKKYGEYGAKPEDFNLITYEKDGKTVHEVVYTAPNGLDLGDPKKNYDEKRSYNSVMSDNNKQAHQVEIDGVAYDARTGMTLVAYKAFVEAKKQAGEELPDSEKNKVTIEGSDYYTSTWLTGERPHAGDARVARVRDSGSVNSRSMRRGDDDRRSVLFRPAVELQLV